VHDSAYFDPIWRSPRATGARCTSRPKSWFSRWRRSYGWLRWSLLRRLRWPAGCL